MSQAETILLGHLKELRALLKRMDKSHVAYQRMQDRIAETKQAIKAVRRESQ